MASVRYGNGIASISGSVAGVTFTQHGVAMGKSRDRIKVKKVLVGDRAAFTYLAQKWREIPNNSRAAWNIWGNENANGFQSFMRINLRRWKHQPNSPILESPPNTDALPNIAFVKFGVQVTGATLDLIMVEFNVSFIVFSEEIQISFSHWKSPGIMRPRETDIKLVTTSSAIDVDGIDCTTDYLNIFGVPPIGSKIFCRIHCLNWDTGQKVSCGGGSAIVE